MIASRKRRLIFIFILLVSVAISLSLALFALRKNIDLYFTPQQLLAAQVSPEQNVRLGGLVVKGSVQRVPNSLKVVFTLTDYQKNIRVKFDGILPSLFHEGQGIIVRGNLNSAGDFIATQVLAKHDASYHPPNIPEKNV